MTDTVAPPAPDPGPEVAERVLARVEDTARRRRARRRVAVAALPVLAVVGLVAATALASGGSDDGDVVTATEPAPTTTTEVPVDELIVTPDTHWTMPTLSADGRTLEVSVSRSCGRRRFVHDAVETPGAVVVGVQTVAEEVPVGPHVGCATAIQIVRIEVVLDAPLGDRSLYDGLGAEPRDDDLMRRGDLVEVTHVPAGFALDQAHLDSPDEPWQQTFTGPGGRSFAVNQVPTALADRFYGEEDGTPITVDDRSALLVSGPMGRTETIRFELGDLTVSVWTDVVQAPLDRDELVRIAEGLRLPPG